jgi:putative flippase GtrA
MRSGDIVVANRLIPSRRGRFVRYALCSVCATAVSALTFAVAYRLLHAGPQVASVAAFAAGAAVNFVANRFWTWSRRHPLGGRTPARGRSDKLRGLGLGRDLAGYLVLAVSTALAAVAVTSVTERHTRAWVLVEASYFATYAAMFLVKFVVLDRVIFRSRHQVVSTTRA